ncbi:MAG: hypothetical protein J5833_08955, partial [Victivallales bacterium]|nr:hypothetical protein [Victivallales bacterium]
MKKNIPRMRMESGGHGIGLARVLMVLLFGLSSLCSAAWNYGYWKEATSYADINEAKKEARDSKRPLLVALSKPEGCNNCRTYWCNIACDVKLHHDKDNCKLGTKNHPIVAYSQEKKIVMVYFSPTVLGNLQSKIMGDEYKKYLNKPTYYPIYILLHVKDNADCDTADANVLNVGNDAGDQVDFIAGYVGISGKPYYNSSGSTTSLKVVTGTSAWATFVSNYESIFTDTTNFNTRGLTLDPEQETDDDYKSATELTFAADNQTAILSNLTLAKDQTQSWFKFQADAGKKYWFKTSAAARGTTTDGLTFDFYKSTGSGDSLAPTGNPLESTSDDDGFALDIGTWSGTVFMKLSRTTATSAYSYNMKYRRTSNTAGGSISTATATVTAGKWTTNYASAKNAGKPMVVAFVKDLWSDDAQALDAYVQTAAFTSAFGSTNYVLIRGAVEGITPDCSSVELFYLRADGSVVGRLTNQPGFVPAEEGTVVTVTDFTGANANVFPQFKTLAAEATEEANNTSGGAADIAFEGDAMTATFAAKLGGVDTVDWYEFQTADTSETWILTFTSASEGNVTVSLTDSEGNEHSSASGNLKNGLLLNFKPEDEGDMMYVKVTSNGIASPIDYTLSVERKIVHYTVEFAKATKRPLLSSEIVEIPVTLTENLAQAGSVSVKVNMASYDNTLYGVGIRATQTGRSRNFQILTWTDEEKVSSPTKSVWLALPDDLDADEANWEGHKDVTLELQDVSENAALGDTKNMTIEVYSKADHAMFEDGDAVSLDLQSQAGDAGAAILNIAAPETTGVFWELVAGEIPAGLGVNVRKSGDNYELKLTPGDIALGSYNFSIKLYTIVEGTQIKGGDTITIGCSIASIADSNPYGASGTMFAGTVFDAESEIIDAKDVSGTLEVAVGEDALTATLTTSMGEVKLTAPEWIESPVNKKILTTTMSGEKDGHAFELALKLGEDGAFVEEDSRLTVDKGTANEVVYGIQGKALLQEQDYEAALVGFGDYYTVDLQPVNADEDLTAKTEGDMQGFGGMSFEINRTNGTIAYKGFLPDGTRFDGTSRLHVEIPEGDDDPYIEFAIFAETKKGTAGT